MDLAFLGRWEWLILELALMAFLVYELVSVNRSLRRDREAARKQGDEPGTPPA